MRPLDWLLEHVVGAPETEVAPVSPETLCTEAIEIFARDPHLEALPVMKDGRLLGLVDRQRLELFRARAGSDLLDRTPIGWMAVAL